MNVKMVIKIAIYLFVFLNAIHTQAQQFDEFNQKRNQTQKNGMAVLTTWAGLNIGLGTVGSITHTGESKYFHQMNIGWNLVNLGLGISGLIQANKENINDLDLHHSLKQYRKTANAFLFNSALNLSYISVGGILLERSKNNPENYHRLQGFGKSLITQGGFLLIFDLGSYFIHRKNRIKRLDPILKNITLSSNNLGFVYHF